MLFSLPGSMPVLPVAALPKVPDLDGVPTADTVGWPRLTRQVAALDASLTGAGERPTSIFTGNYGEAGALDVLGTRDHLPLATFHEPGPSASWRAIWPHLRHYD